MILTDLDPPQNGIRREENSTLAYINNDCKGPGNLYITENDIYWINSTGAGFILKYPDISVFAICTNREKYQESCIFMLVKDENSTEEEDEEDDDSDSNNYSETEIRFAPPDGTDMNELFTCIQECSKLHPNETDDMLSDDDDFHDGNTSDNDEFPVNGYSQETENCQDGQFDDA